MIRLVFILAGIFSAFFLSAQADTVLVFDVATHNISTILPVPFNTVVTSGYSASSVGVMGSKTPLPQTPPLTNTFTGSDFSRLAPAQKFFNVTSYPSCTAVKLNVYYQDTASFGCTGMIVGPCFVLAAAVSFYDFNKQKAFRDLDSIRVLPAFDNGAAQPAFPTARVKRVFAFKSLIAHQNFEDNFAMLELDKPIGIQTGWTGIGFNEAPQFFNNQVFHKFSYPSEMDPSDSKNYNGDTLYYNYGYVTTNGSFLEIPSTSAFAVGGQDGSTLLYSDNTKYYSVAMLTYSTGYKHYKMKRSGFFQFLNLLQGGKCNPLKLGVEEHSSSETLKLFPNPFHGEAVLEFDYDSSEQYRVEVRDLLGRQVMPEKQVDSGSVKISSDALAPGIYVLQLHAGSNTYSCKLAVE